MQANGEYITPELTQSRTEMVKMLADSLFEMVEDRVKTKRLERMDQDIVKTKPLYHADHNQKRQILAAH